MNILKNRKITEERKEKKLKMEINPIGMKPKHLNSNYYCNR